MVIMSVSILIGSAFLALIRFTSGHGPQGGFHNPANVQDRAHLQQHLQGVDAEQLMEEELRFHYFHAHDIDGNKKLDGLEILQAFTHYHAMDELTPGRQDTTIHTDHALQTAIDPLLEIAIDVNQDGFLDYAEFIRAEKFLKEQ